MLGNASQTREHDRSPVTHWNEAALCPSRSQVPLGWGNLTYVEKVRRPGPSRWVARGSWSA